MFKFQFNKITKRRLFSCGIVFAMMLSFVSACALQGVHTKAEDDPSVVKADKTISTFDELMEFALSSQTLDYEGKTIVLANDIKISEINQATLAKYNIKHLTIGSKKVPFKGIFDGQNHTITGLSYDKSILPNANSGLFSYIDHATIKNLTVKNANIDCAYQGGILVGKATASTIKNVTIANSKIHIKPLENVIELVTELGFCGGGVAGIIDEGTMMYNCEVRCTKIYNNATEGVTALGGDGLYLGALVGWANDNSIIEYCRARDQYAGETDTMDEKDSDNNVYTGKTVVKNNYYVAVGALGGKSVYVGGIAGGVNRGTKIVDCFSTADVSFDVSNYVAVGSGIRGYAGGITGALRGYGNKPSSITRCHYAGNLHSRQYNAVAVIPIIQHDVNLSGITRLIKNSSTVSNSYFKRSASTTTKSIQAVDNDKDHADTTSYSSLSNATYDNKSFWESKGYDFVGDVKRTYINGEYNKWVMDEGLGIPVHGKSVLASFDFPGAGTVNISKSELSAKDVTSNEPLSPAYQGFHPGELTKTSDYSKHTISMTLNDGYSVSAWYKKSNYDSTTVSSINQLAKITGNDNLKVRDPDSTDQNSITIDSFADRDLYVAKVKAQVTYHNVDGNTISSEKYSYLDSLDTTDEEKNLTAPADTTFYGWTTISNGGKGYSAASSDQISNIKSKDALYQNGDAVTKTLDLYPVYINQLANVHTIFEGNEKDSSDNTTLRTGVGKTFAKQDDDGNVIINVNSDMSDTNNEDVKHDFPDGYKFRGWFKVSSESDSEKGTAGTCVSRDYSYTVPDTSQDVYYVARFYYRVDYYAKGQFGDNAKHFSEQLYGSKLYTYKQMFQSINGPAYAGEDVIGWGTNYVKHDSPTCNDGYKELITEPCRVYSHNTQNDKDKNLCEIMIDTDFPNSGTLTSEKTEAQTFKVSFKPNESYHINFWTLERNGGKWTYHGTDDSVNRVNSYSTGKLDSLKEYKSRAMVYADVNFHKYDGTSLTKHRRYNDNILISEDKIHTYKYPFYNTADDVDENTYDGDGSTISKTFTSEASPTDESMNITGYRFLGWISSTDVEKDSDTWKYIYDANDSNNKYCTSDASKVSSFLVNKDDLVYEAMDLYPVYISTTYNITTKTNYTDMTINTDKYNKPKEPHKGDVTIDNNGAGSVTITAYSGSSQNSIAKDDSTKFKFVKLLMKVDNGDEEEVKTTANDTETEYTWTGTVKPGKRYVFTAIYTPVMVTYHLDNSNTEINFRNIGDRIGVMASPNFTNIKSSISDLKDYSYMGWTKNKPSSGSVWTTDDNLKFATSNDTLSKSIDLYPVFTKSSIIVNSNIDKILGDNASTYRYGQRDETDWSYNLIAKDYTGYEFEGWYKGYTSETDKGTKISSSHSTTLAPDVKSGTYTAVYNKVNTDNKYTVKYHGLNGQTIYTVYVDKSASRTFVNTMTDPENNKHEYMIDAEANSALALNEHQLFVEWQSVSGSTVTSWNDFKNTKISGDMDLYPVVYEVSAQDAVGVDYTNKLEFETTTSSSSVTGVRANFTESYTQSQLTLNVKKYEYSTTSSKMANAGVEGVPTRVYSASEGSDGTTTYIEASDGPIKTDSDGNAVHKFKGAIKITKKYTDSTIDDVVYVTVTKDNNTVTVPIKVSDGKGSVTINAAFGTYTVAEETKWNWRDEKQTESGLNDSHQVTVNTAGKAEEVTFTNKRINEKWFSETKRQKNEYK